MMLSLIPHKQFTFSKAWIMSARFEVRRLDLPAARRLLGTGIGMCPKEALFKGYIQLEMDVRMIIFIIDVYNMLIAFVIASRVRPCSDIVRKVPGGTPPFSVPLSTGLEC